MNGKTLRGLLVLGAVLAGAAFAACDETGPSPIGVHFDDAGADTGGDDTPPPAEDAGEDAGDDAGNEEDAGQDAGHDSGADAADAADQ